MRAKRSKSSRRTGHRYARQWQSDGSRHSSNHQSRHWRRMAFSNASRVRIREMRRSSCTICTIRRPSSARALRRASTAGMAALPGKLMPSASTMFAIVEAVPMVMQCPLDRCMQTFRFEKFLRLHLPRAEFRSFATNRFPIRNRVRGIFRTAWVRPKGQSSADHKKRLPSATMAWSCRNPSAERLRRWDCHGSIPPRPCWQGCGTAWRSDAIASLPATSREIPEESHPLPKRPASRIRRAHENERCTESAPTRYCRYRSPAGHRTGRRPALVLHPASIKKAALAGVAKPGLATSFYVFGSAHGCPTSFAEDP